MKPGPAQTIIPPALASWGFLLFPGFPMACLTSAIEPLRAANEIVGRAEFAWTLVGERPGPVRSSAEVGFDCDLTLAGAVAVPRALDALVCLSPPDARLADPRAGNAAIRRLGRAGVTLGGFSGGIFPLQRSGAMAGHAPSVHWCYEAAWEAEFPEALISRAAIVRDGPRITVSGAGAVFDLMLRVIEERLGRAVTTEVACWFQHPFVRDEAAPQTRPLARAGGTLDLAPRPVREAIRLFAAHIEEPLPIAEVAARVGLSERTLERAFKAATGLGPLRTYRRMRLDRARQRVLYGSESVAEIARAVGYAVASDFARHYAEAFGLRPADERRRLAGLRGLSGAVPPDGVAFSHEERNLTLADRPR